MCISSFSSIGRVSDSQWQLSSVQVAIGVPAIEELLRTGKWHLGQKGSHLYCVRLPFRSSML